MRLKRALAVFLALVFICLCVGASAATIEYRLKKGEGLADVSKKFGVPLGTLIRLNKHRLPRPNNPDIVFPGMRVIVPVKDTAVAVKAPAASKTAPSPDVKKPAATAVTPEAVKPAETKPAPPADVKQSSKPHLEKPSGESKIFPDEKTVKTISPESHELADTAEPDKPAKRPVVPTAPAPALPSAAGQFEWLAPLLIGVTVVLILAILTALIKLARSLKNGDVADKGPIELVAVKNLGKDAKVWWLKADGKDLFVSTGAETHVISADSVLTGAPEKPARSSAAADKPASTATSSRRPRKNQPSVEPPAEG